MIIDHIMKGKDARFQCFYCGENLTNFRWVSFQYNNTHYKKTKCSCGKNHEVTENFVCSSGHDDWDGHGWMSVDELKELSEKIKTESLENTINNISQMAQASKVEHSSNIIVNDFDTIKLKKDKK